MAADTTLANNLKRFRESRGFSQEKVASFLKIQRELISYYENAKRTPPLETLNRLSDLYGVDLADLLEKSPAAQAATVAIAFRADGLQEEDFEHLAMFRKTIKNYLNLDRPK